jgi:hypothetical protein
MAQRVSSAPPAINATLSGAASGLILFLIVALIEHFFFSGHQAPRYGLAATLIGAAVIGGVFGAVVGLIVAMTRSMPAGIGVGAVLFAAMKFTVIGVAGGFTILAVVTGLIYGAIFGWAVATSALKALEGKS